jgi:hypothetical protein
LPFESCLAILLCSTGPLTGRRRHGSFVQSRRHQTQEDRITHLWRGGDTSHLNLYFPFKPCGCGLCHAHAGCGIGLAHHHTIFLQTMVRPP